MPKIANYMRDVVKAKKIAVIWCNNDFGKGGRDTFIKEAKSRGLEVVADLSLGERPGRLRRRRGQGQGRRARTRSSSTLHEEENARLLREIAQAGRQRCR